MSFTAKQLNAGMEITIKGSGDNWKILQVIDHMMQVTAEHIKSGKIGAVPIHHIQSIIVAPQVAKAEIKSDDIVIIKPIKEPITQKTTAAIDSNDIKITKPKPKPKKRKANKKKK